jgi:hypothetical protein
MLACVCAIADEGNEGRYREPEFGADYCEQEPEVPNAEPALSEDFEDGKFNFPPLMHDFILVL